VKLLDGEHRTSNIEHRTSKAGSFGAPFDVRCFLATLALLFLCGCCAGKKTFIGSRPFDFQHDTFSYGNGLVWEYYYDDNGKWMHQRREPEPDYHHHCFVVARSARQFFQNARFDPALPVATEEEYRKLVERVVSIDPARTLSEEKKIVIPGYANLRAFSEEHEKILKAECGGAWRSYFQRGHWRVILPFSRGHQQRTAEQLVEDLKQNRPPVVHIICFPSLSINHALLLFDVKENEKTIDFFAYDPNRPDKPKMLTFDRASRTFNYPANDYFPGGDVDIYEIYRSWLY
jgi:hypothetical protein